MKIGRYILSSTCRIGERSAEFVVGLLEEVPSTGPIGCLRVVPPPGRAEDRPRQGFEMKGVEWVSNVAVPCLQLFDPGNELPVVGAIRSGRDFDMPLWVRRDPSIATGITDVQGG